MYRVKTITDKDSWDTYVQKHSGHPLQLWGWGEVKAKHGWKAHRFQVTVDDTPVLAAQVLVRTLPWPFNAMAYVPRGPIGTDDIATNHLASHIKDAFKPVGMTMEPDSIGQTPPKGWKRSNNRILLGRTATMNLTDDTDTLLSMMSKKTRQYIRKSAGENVQVNQVISREKLNECLAIYKDTAERAGFSLHDDSYYYDIFDELGDMSHVYAAEKEGRVVAFLWPIVTNDIAFELYGGMNTEGQALRANYHLKWYVIQAMKSVGVRRYDVNGLLNDGVTSFKKGFIPDETMMSGTFVKPLSPIFFVWERLLPIVKKIVQKLRP